MLYDGPSSKISNLCPSLASHFAFLSRAQCSESVRRLQPGERATSLDDLSAEPFPDTFWERSFSKLKDRC